MSSLNWTWSDDERGRIERDVRKAFSRDSKMGEATKLSISFSGARTKSIHVHGEVPNEAIRDRALQIVRRNIPEGIEVADDLTIEA